MSQTDRNFEFLFAKAENSEVKSLIINQKSIEISTFSDSLLNSIPSFTQSMLRSRARGTILLSETIRKLHEKIRMDSNTAIYLHAMDGPFYRKAFFGLDELNELDKMAAISKNLPPKQYFLQSVAMKAAQIPIDFGLHGQWVAFNSHPHGFQQAWDQALRDLKGGVSNSVLICGVFALDEPAEIFPYSEYACELFEANISIYLDRNSNLNWTPSFKIGKFGPLTGILEETIGI